MSRQKKRRNKQYTGQDAAPQSPVVHRYTAEIKSPHREWWDNHKRSVKLISGISGGAAIVGWLLFELFRMIFG